MALCGLMFDFTNGEKMKNFGMVLCTVGLLGGSLVGCSSNDNNANTTSPQSTTPKSTTLSSAQIVANNEKIYGKKVDSGSFDALLNSTSENNKNPRVTKIDGNIDKTDGFTDETMDGGTYQVWAGCAKGSIKIIHNRKIIAKDVSCNGTMKNVVDKVCVVKGSNNFTVETSSKTSFVLGTIKTNDSCNNSVK